MTIRSTIGRSTQGPANKFYTVRTASNVNNVTVTHFFFGRARYENDVTVSILYLIMYGKDVKLLHCSGTMATHGKRVI
jgi:hypothetical protein